jgi:hypothetical protein
MTAGPIPFKAPERRGLADAAEGMGDSGLKPDEAARKNAQKTPTTSLSR